jgi:hypothetical protein
MLFLDVSVDAATNETLIEAAKMTMNLPGFTADAVLRPASKGPCVVPALAPEKKPIKSHEQCVSDYLKKCKKSHSVGWCNQHVKQACPLGDTPYTPGPCTTDEVYNFVVCIGAKAGANEACKLEWPGFICDSLFDNSDCKPQCTLPSWADLLL